MLAETISIFAVLVAGLSALYSRWAVKEAKKANELNRFNALLDLKSSYIKEMQEQIKAAKEWGSDDGFAQACRDSYANAQIKYREVNEELDLFHAKIVQNEI